MIGVGECVEVRLWVLYSYPSWRWTRDDGRRESIGWLNDLPVVRWVSEIERDGIGWLNASPSSRWVSEDGSEEMGWLKWLPSVRWVRLAGRESIGRLKLLPRVRWVSLDGSESTRLLNLLIQDEWWRKRIHWFVYGSNCQMGKTWRKRIHWLVESIGFNGKRLEGGWKRIDWMIKFSP